MKNIFKTTALILALSSFAPEAHAGFVAGNHIDPRQLIGNADSRVKHKPVPVQEEILLAAVPGDMDVVDSDPPPIIIVNDNGGYNYYGSSYAYSTQGDPAAYRGAPYQNFRGYGNESGYTNSYSGYNNTSGYRSGYSF